MLAPICLFTYNRLEQTKRTIEALKENYLAKESRLIIFSDGPKDELGQKKIQLVRDYLKTVDGFASVEIRESELNKGLANSIVDGVTEIVNMYGNVIVLEDDLVTSPYFLNYMNDALDYYANNPEVFQVSAFMFPISEEGLPDTFFYQANTCWGWGTWSRAWKFYEHDLSKISHALKTKKISWKHFNSMQGFAFQMQFKRNQKNRIKTWAVRWHAAIKIHNGKVLHPKKTLVENIGLDGSGTNSKKEYIKMDISNIHNIDITSAYNQEGGHGHKMALNRLKKYFSVRYSLWSILNRKLRKM